MDNQLNANRSTPANVTELRSNNLAIAVNEKGSKDDRNSDHFNGHCHVYVDASNTLAMRKASVIARLQSTSDDLAIFLCKSPSDEALRQLQILRVSVNFN